MPRRGDADIKLHMSIGKKAGQIGMATFLSRIFGLVREQIFAALMGAGYYADAFVIAFRIPNLLRDLFAEGALSNAFVPTFTDYRMNKSPSQAWQLANLVLGMLCVVVGTLTVLGIIFAPQVVQVIAPGFAAIEGKQELTVYLTRIMMPFLLFVSVAALLMGMLNTYEEFAIPALAPVVFNVVSISAGLVIYSIDFSAETAVIGWAVGTLLAGVAQMAIQFPKLVSLGWKIRPTARRWKMDAGLHQIFWMMIPAIIANSGTQVNVLVNSVLASMLAEGSASWLNYAFRLIQLPIGVFGVTISVVTLAKSSQNMASQSFGELKNNLTSAINLVVMLTLPCMIGFFVLGEPIIRLIYEHGAFKNTDTHATALAIYFYAIGLPAYAAVKVLAPIFFVFKSSKTPMIASLVGISGNILFNVLCYKTLGHRGLALGTSIGVTLNLIILFYFIQTKFVKMDLRLILVRCLQVLLSSLTMGIAAYGMLAAVQGKLDGFAAKFAEVLLPIIAGMSVYFLMLGLFKFPEMNLLREKLVRRFGRKR